MSTFLFLGHFVTGMQPHVEKLSRGGDIHYKELIRQGFKSYQKHESKLLLWKRFHLICMTSIWLLLIPLTWICLFFGFISSARFFVDPNSLLMGLGIALFGLSIIGNLYFSAICYEKAKKAWSRSRDKIVKIHAFEISDEALEEIGCIYYLWYVETTSEVASLKGKRSCNVPIFEKKSPV